LRSGLRRTRRSHRLADLELRLAAELTLRYVAVRRPETLPRADRAVVLPDKLERYVAQPAHEIGPHKARVFAAALRIGQGDWECLGDQLLVGVLSTPVRSVRETALGTALRGRGRSRRTQRPALPVRTAWLVAGEDDPPTLVTAYVAPAGRPHNGEEMKPRPAHPDVVELREARGKWPAGTVGTVVEASTGRSSRSLTTTAGRSSS